MGLPARMPFVLVEANGTLVKIIMTGSRLPQNAQRGERVGRARATGRGRGARAIIRRACG